jgi:predicted nucleotidyltransferase
MTPPAAYPSSQHKQAAQRIVEFFSAQNEIDAVLLTNSCARGKASTDSCLDIAILVPPEVLKDMREDLEHRWQNFYQTEPVFAALHQRGRYSEVHLDYVDGAFTPEAQDPSHAMHDEFELSIGNYLVYSVPLWQRTHYLEELKAKWLPYYSETLRRERLAIVRRYCLNHLDHISLYVPRGLYFQSLSQLHQAFWDFLHALFIARRTYPIAYDKWIREQVEEILGLPVLYQQLPSLFEIRHFESSELMDKARALEQLLEEYAPDEGN